MASSRRARGAIRAPPLCSVGSSWMARPRCRSTTQEATEVIMTGSNQPGRDKEQSSSDRVFRVDSAGAARPEYGASNSSQKEYRVPHPSSAKLPAHAESEASVDQFIKANRQRFWKAAVVGVTLVTPIILAYLFTARTTNGLSYSEAMDYAQIGRNLASGRGFTTSILRPLALTHGSAVLAQPDVTHGPLYPFFLALAFGLCGAKDSTVLAVSALFYVLTTPLVYLLGARLFRPTVGLVAAAVYAVSVGVLQYVATGADYGLCALLGTCTLYTVARAASAAEDWLPGEPVPARAWIIACGACAGLLYLTDPLYIWALPVVLVALRRLYPTSTARAWVWGAAPMAILVLPWMIRNTLVTGNPVFGLVGREIWMGTGAYPGLSAYRLGPDDIVPSMDMFKSFLLKLFLNAQAVLIGLQLLPAGWILIFVVPGLFQPPPDAVSGSVRRLSLFAMLAVLGGSALFRVQMQLAMFVLPALLVFGSEYLLRLAAGTRMTGPVRFALAAAFAFAMLGPLINAVALTHSVAALPQSAPASELARTMRPGEVALSDQPWIVAWYADRPAVWIPDGGPQVDLIRKRFVGCRWLMLTDQIRDYPPEWQMAYRSLLQWDFAVLQARMAGTAPPPPITISGSVTPIVNALNGFQSVSPSGTELPAAVLAHLPDEGASRRASR